MVEHDIIRPEQKTGSPIGIDEQIGLVQNRWQRQAPGYLGSVRSAAESSLTGLNSSVNWAFTLTLALITVASQSYITDPTNDVKLVFAFSILVLSIPLNVHFGIRTMKSYLNVIRFSTLERAVLTSVLDDSSDEGSIEQTVDQYHVRWISPIPIRTALRKTVFEFGFLYPLIGIGAALFYLTPTIWALNYWFVIGCLIIAFLAAFIEAISFKKSAYGRTVLVDNEAKRLA